MSTMTTSTPDVDRLHVSTVDAKPVSVQWSGDDYSDEYSDEYREPAPFWEAFEYEQDGQTFTLIASGGSVAAVLIDGHPFTSYDDYADAWRDEHGGDSDDGTPEALSEDEFEDLLAVEPYSYGAEGPMMNYLYLIEETAAGSYGGSSFDPIEAAAKLAHLPLCIVMHDDEYGMALTGGGMDFSWEISAAYVALGKLPPVHFSDLPAYAGEWSERNEGVYRAMRRSLDVMVRRADYALERLERTRSQMQWR